MKVGIDVFVETMACKEAGKRVGLLSHQAALGRNGATSAQILRRTLGKNLVSLFGPEHGFFGTFGPGESTVGRSHPDWNIPVYALYGETRKPTGNMLKGLDVLIIDLQDLGVRCYTYLATLHLALQACAEAGVRVIVTDRPIPLPETVDGPGLDPALESFVAPLPLPMVYGMTQGEAALWMVKHGAIQADVRVAPLRGYHRRDLPKTPREGWPDFVPPSPGIRSRESAQTYAATVFCEALPSIDCGRGTSLAFRVLGAPWLRAQALCEAMESEACTGVTFSPCRYLAEGGNYDGQELDGVRLSVTDTRRFKPVQTSLHLLRSLTNLYGSDRIWRGKNARPGWFDKLYGNTITRQQLCDGESLEKIVKGWPRFSRVRLYS